MPALGCFGALDKIGATGDSRRNPGTASAISEGHTSSGWSGRISSQHTEAMK